MVKTKNFGDGETTNENVVWNIHTWRKARCVENPQCAKEIDWDNCLKFDGGRIDAVPPSITNPEMELVWLSLTMISIRLLEPLGAKDVSRVVLWT